MSNKTYGLSYERKEKKLWESLGFKAHRSRGSFGLFDMIVTSPLCFRLISVKAEKIKHSYKRHINDIDNFKEIPVGTIKLLVLYQKGKRKVLYEQAI